MHRRKVLSLAVSAGMTSALLPTMPWSADEAQPGFRITDTNISLFRWPFRRLPLDETDALVSKLRSLGITQSWAGSFEGILHRDIAGVNQRLTDGCRVHSELIPIGTINPELPDWEEELRRCIDEHNMPGIRLHPNYHGYTLDDPRFRRCLELATASGRFVQIAAAVEDTRTQHTLVQVPDVDLVPLAKLLTDIPEAKVQILNQNLRPPLLQRLCEFSGVYIDTARVEGTDGIPRLVQSVPPGRVMFGSHSPLLIPEAALIRVHESEILDETMLNAVFSENARQAFGNLTA
ncbi:MAG: amidohydrolase family protein [Planctomycetota bacterium]|nr:amidohydrolase family protein [Planctomycetota bacterium]